MMLSGWGRFPTAECRAVTARETAAVEAILAQSPSLIARGNGRAYGDAAMNRDATLLMRGCDRFLAFDAENGVIECEAGVLLADILDLVVAHGWFPGVVPGTKFVSVGGLIAADVHGKNHHVSGSFGHYVDSFRLALPGGDVLTCSRSENSELFFATLGGMGLTGVILSARLRLHKIQSDEIEETVVRAASLDALMALFEQHNAATYSVAWIDCLSQGSAFGRGVLMLGEHADKGATGRRTAKPAKRGARLSIPVELPLSPLNRWSIRLFNELYYAFQKPRSGRTHYDRFFFPLDSIENWNRIYGRRGFVQYQCVIGEDAPRALRRILDIVRQMGTASFLAVLKKLGTGQKFLSFPREGYTITLDFPVRRDTMSGLAKLDEVVADHGGRIYLAKDARAPRELIERGYPEIGAFRDLRRKIDPDRKIRSLLADRLEL